MDVLLQVPHLPARQQDINIAAQQMKSGGCAYNVYEAVKCCGGQPHFAGVVGKGAFAGPGLESGNEYAVIPLFNTAQEILGEGTYVNTSKGTAPVPTVKHTTTVTFTRPVDAAAVLESAVNAFIVVNSKSSGVFSRDTEVHMPTYKPTGFAVVSGNTFTEAEPYKYFVSKGTGMKDNYMMWALMIPGEFRYPAERKDIRTAYTYFNAWAASGGAQHVDWYEDEADEDMLY